MEMFLQVIHPCLICECELPHNYNNLDRHFKREHDMGVIDYYNQHISKTPEAEVTEVILGLILLLLSDAHAQLYGSSVINDHYKFLL